METLQSGTEPAIVLTPQAVRQVKHLIAKRGNPSLGLRVAVRGGGCSGLSYALDLDEQATDRDLVFDADGVRVLVDRRSARFLGGTTIDYSLGNLLEGGWVFRNPNASRTCGCGSSFTPKPAP